MAARNRAYAVYVFRVARLCSCVYATVPYANDIFGLLLVRQASQASKPSKQKHARGLLTFIERSHHNRASTASGIL